MEQFLETYSLPKLIQEEMDTLSRPTTSRKIEFVFKKFPAKKVKWTGEFTGKFYQTHKEEITPMLFKEFLQNEDDKILKNSF